MKAGKPVECKCDPQTTKSKPEDGWTLEEIYREALMNIKRMEPCEIVPGIVHGPALLFSNCQRIADRALKGKRPDSSAENLGALIAAVMTRG